MLAKIKDILVISTGEDKPKFIELLGNGARLGLNFSYISQEKPRGIAEAFILGKEFIGNDSCCLILGDNIFYGHGFSDMLRQASKKENNCPDSWRC